MAVFWEGVDSISLDFLHCKMRIRNFPKIHGAVEEENHGKISSAPWENIAETPELQ